MQRELIARKGILRTEVINVRHGFESTWFGRRTRSLGRGGRRTAATFVDAPFGGMAKIEQCPASASRAISDGNDTIAIFFNTK